MSLSIAEPARPTLSSEPATLPAIQLQSTGTAASPQENPVLGIPIPGDDVPGGVVQVNSYSDITTTNNNAPGIHASSQTTGYPQSVIDNLNSFNPSNITFSVSSVLGSASDVGQAVSGVVIDTNGLPVAGNGGTFTISGSGTYSFDPGTAFTNLAEGASETVRVQYDVVLSSSGGSLTATAYLLVTATMINSNLTYLTNAYFPEFGVQQYSDKQQRCPARSTSVRGQLEDGCRRRWCRQ